ncbi:MAG: V-type ATP synthase subunit A [Acidobacteriota bacterium]
MSESHESPQGPEQAGGRLVAVAGAVVRGETDLPVALGDIARVGENRLLGEIIALEGRTATIQVYEDTTGLAPGDPFFAGGAPLSVELGPGLLGEVFDGIARPLERLAAAEGDFLGRGRRAFTLDRERLWEFAPSVRAGDLVRGGAVLGVVSETASIEHRVLVPPSLEGKILEIRPAGPTRVADAVARLETGSGTVALPLFHRWRVRSPRPFRERLPLSVPLVTGQRVFDTFFPLPRGGAAGMPGGFGTGKTVTQHQLCKWARADVIVYVGCGERGNEMTRVLREIPELADPRTGHALVERTVLVANTSNMPVAAREASIYTAATIAEYFRDMGYHVAVLADSTSRWAEALREISGRLEEMPAEEGYPPYLATRLAAFYERAGRVTALSGREGSVSLISAISPPGGDMSEPVTRHTRRFTRCFWALDKERAEARVFPAVNIQDSYGEVTGELEAWWSREAPEWGRLRRDALALLEEATRVERTARLVGRQGLPDRERFLLRAAALLEEGFLRQSAFEPKDASCSPARQAALLSLLLGACDRAFAAIGRGVPAARLEEAPILAALERAKSEIGDEEVERFADLAASVGRAIDALEAEAAAEAAPAPPGGEAPR